MRFQEHPAYPIIKEHLDKPKKMVWRICLENGINITYNRVQIIYEYIFYKTEYPIMEDSILGKSIKWQDTSPDRVTDYKFYHYLIRKFRRENKWENKPKTI